MKLNFYWEPIHLKYNEQKIILKKKNCFDDANAKLEPFETKHTEKNEENIQKKKKRKKTCDLVKKNNNNIFMELTRIFDFLMT